MRTPATSESIEKFMTSLAARVRGPGRIYLVGGATAVLQNWRETTIDVDLKADPEPGGFFEAIADLKDDLALNVELASPDQFLPELPGWQERSLFIARHHGIDFFHYDPCAQVLAKIERGHARDLHDVQCFAESGLVKPEKLRELFAAIREKLIRFPAVDAATLSAKVEAWNP